MPSLEERIAALEARAACDELRSRYAWYAIRGDAKGVASLFTENCIFDGPAGPNKRAVINGRKALEEFLHPSIGTPGVVLPLIHNDITEILGPDKARGSCVMETPAAPGFGHLVNQYIEEFERVRGVWYFSVRRMYLFIPYREPQPAEHVPTLPHHGSAAAKKAPAKAAATAKKAPAKKAAAKKAAK
jgi:hypothetical protein